MVCLLHLLDLGLLVCNDTTVQGPTFSLPALAAHNFGKLVSDVGEAGLNLVHSGYARNNSCK